MLVILTEDQIFSPKQICQTCLMANQRGEPRWRNGRLCCGHAIHSLTEDQPDQYECNMGFRIANIE